MKAQKQILYLWASIGFAILFTGIIVGILGNISSRLIISLLLSSLGAAILFPILVSFAYDRIREKWMGDEIWRIFTELSDAGILRIYKDREKSPNPDNAESRFVEEFERFRSGEILMMGVSLRVFLNVQGTFFHTINDMIQDNNGAAKIRALVSDPSCPEAKNRDIIESEGSAQIERDVHSSIVGVKTMCKQDKKWVQLRTFSQAPYCTVVIFPDKLYYSPNILCETVPVRLPMIVFRNGSHAYEVIKRSFEYIWKNSKDVLKLEQQNVALENRSMPNNAST